VHGLGIFVRRFGRRIGSNIPLQISGMTASRRKIFENELFFAVIFF